MALTGALDGAPANMSAVFSNFGLRGEDGDAALVAGDPVGALVAAVQARADRERAAGGAAGAPTSDAAAADSSASSAAAPEGAAGARMETDDTGRPE
jgi:hypothetical protein